jgi:hypothetical protein
MARPKTKEETGTIRVSLRVKAIIAKRAKANKMSIPDYINNLFANEIL